MIALVTQIFPILNQMDMNQFNLPISMLRQYCFCPRIPFFYLVRQLQPIEQPWIQSGLEEHNRQKILQKRRNLSRYGIKMENDWEIHSNIELFSDKLHIHGICDAVVKCSSKTFILEFKNSESVSDNTGARIQLAAYSMVYEDIYGVELTEGFIIYGAKAKTFKVSIDQSIRKKVIDIRDEIFASMKSGILPVSSAAEKKCSQCEFFNFCADRY